MVLQLVENRSIALQRTGEVSCNSEVFRLPSHGLARSRVHVIGLCCAGGLIQSGGAADVRVESASTSVSLKWFSVVLYGISNDIFCSDDADRGGVDDSLR